MVDHAFEVWKRFAQCRRAPHTVTYSVCVYIAIIRLSEHYTTIEHLESRTTNLLRTSKEGTCGKFLVLLDSKYSIVVYCSLRRIRAIETHTDYVTVCDARLHCTKRLQTSKASSTTRAWSLEVFYFASLGARRGPKRNMSAFMHVLRS